jgi:hypothetical protein
MRKSNLLIFILLIFLIALPFCSAQSAYGPSIKTDAYEISRSKIERKMTEGYIFKDFFKITNFQNRAVTVSIHTSDELADLVELDSSGGIIESKNFSEFFFSVIGKKVGEYSGNIVITGDIEVNIPVNFSVVNESLNPQFFVTVELVKKEFTFKDKLDFKANINKIVGDEIKNVSFSYLLVDSASNKTYLLGNEVKDLIGSLQIRKKMSFPEGLKEGYYVLDITTDYNNQTYVSSAEFRLSKPFWSITLFGVLPLWVLAIILGVLTLGIIVLIYIRRAIEKSKKYKMQLDLKTLAKKGERTLWLGKIAETNIPAYLEMDALTTHAVVAGATGGGKSISAQVIIEEVLKQDVAVIVFDPTAQWSGLLRKCTDKKMFGVYPAFGLKPTDARAFPGNVRQIQSERQAIDINKYMTPGQIQIFTMNKLTPQQIDVFVATVIASIFKSDPKEYPGLRLMIVFDEVHRLLPKFGGSGKGFLQIERACREFRKWGFGVMLVSQVLSDFVGEIKANINTEVQMRTRDESDLNRIKTKYGEEFLQSLIKASVGVGMFVNPRYNKGKPYFIQFRPILHNTRRLSDQVLEQYNKYSETIDDMEYQIEQLEKEKVDAFDLKMELKLVKDKLMSGNFTVVDIYLEGLTPRLDSQWQTLGKKPKKKELELVNTSDVEASIKAAESSRKDWSAEQKKEGEPAKEEKIEEKSVEKKEDKVEKPDTLEVKDEKDKK